MSARARNVRVTCPAKINLNLSVFGLREDGFHDLRSVVVPIALEDELEIAWDPVAEGPDRLVVEGADCGEERQNSVMKAFKGYREAAGRRDGRFAAALRKRIPVGAGLGGGSSDAAGALRALGTLFPGEVAEETRRALGLSLGSDVPLFFSKGPVLMEGRGESLSPLPEDLAKRLQGRAVWLFKPPFAVATGEAYQRLAKAGLYDVQKASSESFLREWRDSGQVLPPGGNRFEDLLARWLPAVPVLLDRLRSRGFEATALSGSGSACFLIAGKGEIIESEISGLIRSAWGPTAWSTKIYIKI